MAKYLEYSGLSHYDTKIKNYIDTEDAKKQDLLVSGTNIKKLENIDLLGSGTINVKTINNQSILGSGNLGVSRLLYDDQSEMITLDDGKNDVTIQLKQDNTALNIDATALDDRGQIQQIINMNLADKQYVDDEVSPKQGQILKTQSGLEADVLIQGTQNFDTVLLADETYVDNKTSQATETTLGTIKLNSNESVGVNANGQLTVGGRLGQFPTTTGIYASNDREPRAVGDSSFLITDAKGMSLDTSRAFALVSGLGVTCKSAPAGSTEYRVSNTYANRLLCKTAENGYISRDEATSKIEQIIPVVSVTIDGQAYTPNSSANNTSKDIVIKTATTLNPDSAITNIRICPVMKSYSTAHIGNGIASWGGGRNLLLGGGVTKDGSSNDDCIVGNGMYCSGNGNAAFGRYHIIRKNRGFFAGQGHDSTNATGEGVSAIGQYSYIDANTLFAVGNGSSHTARLNNFEVLKDGSIVLRSPNGTRYKIAVDDSGNLTTTAI